MQSKWWFGDIMCRSIYFYTLIIVSLFIDKINPLQRYKNYAIK